MSATRRAIDVSINVPFITSGASNPLTSSVCVPPGREADYLLALKREIISAAADAKGGSVERVSFVGGSAVNMSLATWCSLMDSLVHGYPGADRAFLLLDVVPGLVNSKTIAYAFRFRSCINMRLESVDGAELERLDRIKAAMEHERFSSWGIELKAGALGGGPQAVQAVRRLLALGADYIRVFDASAAVADSMGSAGLSRIAPGLYSGSPRYANWFSDRPSSMKMGFGLGALSSVGGERFKATEDVGAYIAKAGLSMDIYSPES